MRPPLEYGDNFPVPAGSWDPTVPWRFPQHEVRLKAPSPVSQILPWFMLWLGVTLVVLWMGWWYAQVHWTEGGRSGSAPSPSAGMTRERVEMAPRSQPMEAKGRLCRSG